MFLSILVCLLPFYPFYYFSKINTLQTKSLIYFFIGMLPIAIYAFYRNQIQFLEKLASGETNMVNNISYIFVRLMPFVFLIKKYRLISAGLMAILMIFIILGSKRGALLIGALILLIYFYYLLKIGDKRKKIQSYFIGFLSAAVLFVMGYRFFLENEFLLDRLSNISEGGGSGRDVIYTAIIDGWYYSESFVNFLFGFGFAGSVKLTGNLAAHNDWLESLSNFGLLGVLVYLILITTAIKTSFNKKLWNYDKRVLLKVIVFSWLIISMISMWYLNIHGYLQTILLAYLVGNNTRSIE